MDLPDLIREALAAGRLREPFSARELARALSNPNWSLSRIHSFLVRYCSGNLAASQVLVERVVYGRYRLIYDAVRRHRVPAPTSFRRGPVRNNIKEDPLLPGEPES